jgi:hypothetical protein
MSLPGGGHHAAATVRRPRSPCGRPPFRFPLLGERARVRASVQPTLFQIEPRNELPPSASRIPHPTDSVNPVNSVSHQCCLSGGPPQGAHGVCLSWRGGERMFCVMHQPAFSSLRHLRHVHGSNCERHEITFPSNRAVGAAAQSNSTVSIAPPRHPSTKNSALFRRHDGYSAKS